MIQCTVLKSSVDSNYCILKGHILGDATGELGKFECNTPEYNDWRFGMWLSVEIGTPGLSTRGSVGGQFSYNMHPITSTLAGYFMVVLSPQQ